MATSLGVKQIGLLGRYIDGTELADANNSKRTKLCRSSQLIGGGCVESQIIKEADPSPIVFKERRNMVGVGETGVM